MWRNSGEAENGKRACLCCSHLTRWHFSKRLGWGEGEGNMQTHLVAGKKKDWQCLLKVSSSSSCRSEDQEAAAWFLTDVCVEISTCSLEEGRSKHYLLVNVKTHFMIFAWNESELPTNSTNVCPYVEWISEAPFISTDLHLACVFLTGQGSAVLNLFWQVKRFILIRCE